MALLPVLLYPEAWVPVCVCALLPGRRAWKACPPAAGLPLRWRPFRADWGGWHGQLRALSVLGLEERCWVLELAGVQQVQLALLGDLLLRPRR